MSNNTTILSPQEYIAEAISHMRRAKKRVWLMSMMLAEDKTTDEFTDVLTETAQRGISVTVAADVFTYGELGGHFAPLKYFKKASRVTTKMTRELSDNGVDFYWLGRTLSTPVHGRTHIKCLVIDDTVYSFGGVNLYERGLKSNDYMLRCVSERLADDLVHEFGQIVKADKNGYVYRSHRFSFKDDTVLTDGGFIGDSLIYRRACQLAEDATNILLVSQYCPTGKLNRIIKSKEARCYFNRPSQAHGFDKMVIKTGMFFSHNKSLYKRKKYLHAKFIIYTMPNGSKVALTGSHNFVYGGVLLGTREIALETRDPKIIRQLEKFFMKNVA